MKITKRQLRRIIIEATYDQLPYDMGGPWVDKDAPSGKGAEEYDDLDRELTDKEIEASMGWEPAGGGEVSWKEGDLVRSVDYVGDEWGGDFEKVVGDQVGTIIEIEKDIDGTQYTVLFPDGTTIMDSAGPPDERNFELVNEGKMKITKRQLRRIVREAIGSGGPLPYDEDPTADEWYESRHADDQNDMEYYIAVSLESAARANSGVNGQNLLRIARQDPEYAPVLQGVTDERMWEVADTMIEDDTLFFDVEEDAWYYAPEMR